MAEWKTTLYDLQVISAEWKPNLFDLQSTIADWKTSLYGLQMTSADWKLVLPASVRGLAAGLARQTPTIKSCSAYRTLPVRRTSV